MKDFLKRILKPFIIILLPIIIEEIKKLIEECLAGSPKKNVTVDWQAGNILSLLSSETLVDRLKEKIDQLL